MSVQWNNSNGKVKSKFFNQELFDETKMSDVGGSSTSGQVISWGVGGNKNNTNSNAVSDFSVLDSTQMFNLVNTEFTDFEENNSYSNMNNNSGLQDSSNALSEQGDFTTSVNDVLADARYDSSTISNNVSNDFAQNVPIFTGYNANNTMVNDMSEQANMNHNTIQEVNTTYQFNGNNVQVPINNVQPVMNNVGTDPGFDPFNAMAEPAQPYGQSMQLASQTTDMSSFNSQMQQNSPIFAMAAESQAQQIQQTSSGNELTPLNISASDGVISDDMRSNQPLSLMALSGESIDEEQKPKDVLENNKYFQNTPLEDNRLKAEEVVVTPAAPVVDVLAEPTRDINMKELVKDFIGLKFSKISMSPFSFCGAFFGTLYYFYRKMFVQGFILAIIGFIISLVSVRNTAVGLGLNLVYFIVVGLITNPIYLSFATNKVKKIVAVNPKLNQYELQRIVQKQGGTSLSLAILLNIIVNSASSYLLVLIVGLSVIVGQFNLESSKDIIKEQEDIDILELVSFILPTGFVIEKDKDFDYYVYETYTKRGEEVQIEACGFDISVPKGQSDSKKLIEDMANRDQRYNKVGTFESFMGDVWDEYSYEGKDRKYIYRAKKVKDHVVLISYTIHDKATEGKCEAYLEDIMNSLIEK